MRRFSRVQLYPWKKFCIHIHIHEIHGYTDISMDIICRNYLHRESLSMRSLLIVLQPAAFKLHFLNSRRSWPLLNSLSTSTSTAGSARVRQVPNHLLLLPCVDIHLHITSPLQYIDPSEFKYRASQRIYLEKATFSFISSSYLLLVS